MTAHSYEWHWEISADPSGVDPMWLPVPAFTGLSPSTPPHIFAGATYANGGSPRRVKTGEDFSLAARVKGVLVDGDFGPELLMLIDAAESGGTIGYRYFHARSSSLAWAGTALVSWSRANTGNAEAEFFSVELVGQGDRKRIIL